jgi:hypothetical protein
MKILEKKTLIFMFLKTVEPHCPDKIPLISREEIRDAVFLGNEKLLRRVIMNLMRSEHIWVKYPESKYYLEHKGIEKAKDIIRSLTKTV